MAGLAGQSTGGEPPTKTARFCVPSEKEIEELIDNKDSSRSKDVIRYAEGVFTSFCQELGTTVTDAENSLDDSVRCCEVSMRALDSITLSCIRENQ